MIISGNDIGKRFGKNWIIRDLNFEFRDGEQVALTGSNGSGKSTLLQIIAGYLTPTAGNIILDDEPVAETKASIGFVAPYSEIIEEFTLNEFLQFHNRFRTSELSFEEMADRASLPLHRPISEFSTGMKQRSKLLTVFFFQNDLIFMDEPTSNLDQEGVNWWKKEAENLSASCLTFLASNQKQEIEICSQEIHLKKT